MSASGTFKQQYTLLLDHLLGCGPAALCLVGVLHLQQSSALLVEQSDQHNGDLLMAVAYLANHGRRGILGCVPAGTMCLLLHAESHASLLGGYITKPNGSQQRCLRGPA